jgi:uncharacterized membrane protein (DUF4010 family)
MEVFELFERLGLALAIGLLIGVERGWRGRERARGSRTAGIRTYGLSALLGGVLAALVPTAGPLPLTLVGFAFTIVFAAFQWRESKAEKNYSVTGVVAAVLSFALGAYAVLGDVTVAVGAGVAVTGLLAARQTLHQFLRQLTWPEIRSAFVLLAMTFLLLPVLPREAVDPWGALVPYEMLVLVIVLALLSFAGYVGVRVMGTKRGLIAASAAGALVSSTAVTLNNSRLAAKAAVGKNELAGAVCAAWIVSLVRMSVIACVLNQALVLPLGVPILAAVAVLGLSLARFYRGDGTLAADSELTLRNPFELSAVFTFAVLLTIVLAAAQILSEAIGETGLFALAAATGFVDVDPVAISVAQLAGQSVGINEAALAILIAGSANIITKAAITLTIGGKRFGSPLAISGGAALVLALAVWFFGAGTAF